MNNEDKRYQVFISSTFNDLKAERAEVTQALLELDCIPRWRGSVSRDKIKEMKLGV